MKESERFKTYKQDDDFVRFLRDFVIWNEKTYSELAGRTNWLISRDEFSDDIKLTGDEKKLWFYNGTNYITFTASGSMTGDYDWSWPVDYGTNTYQLTTDGAGGLSWTASGAGAFSSGDYETLTWSDGASASSWIWTFNLDTGTDPVITYGDGTVNVSTGELQEGGAAVYTMADGALNDDDITDDAIGSLNNVDTTGLAVNKVLKYNGTNFVVADYNEDLSFDVLTFTDNISSPVLLGSGQWLAVGGATFEATYLNGPPSAATIAISGDFNDSGTGWTADTLTMTDPFASKATTEITNYPDDSGDIATFTLTADGDSDLSTTVTFYNYFIYDDFASNSGFTDGNLDTIASGGTQIVTSDHTRTFTQIIGASNYMVFAHRLAGTTVAQVRCGTGSNQITAAFNKNDATAVTPLKETVSHSNAAANPKTENFYVYASLSQNLDDVHSSSFTTLTSATPQNYIEWGTSTINTGWSSAQIVAFVSQYAENSYTSTTRYTSINPGANDYIVFAFPSRLLGSAIPTGTDYETDGNVGTGWVFDGVTCAVAAAETIAVTNAAGFQENYEVYGSVGKDYGDASTQVLKTYTSTQALNIVYWGEHTGADASEALIEGMNGGSSAKSNDNTRTFSLAPGAGEYIWFAYPKRLGTVSIKDTDTQLPLSLYASSPQTVSVTNFNGWSEDYYAYRSEFANLGTINLETY